MAYDPAYQRQYYLERREALCQEARDRYDRERDTRRKRAWVSRNRQRYTRYQADYYRKHNSLLLPDEAAQQAD